MICIGRGSKESVYCLKELYLTRVYISLYSKGSGKKIAMIRRQIKRVSLLLRTTMILLFLLNIHIPAPKADTASRHRFLLEPLPISEGCTIGVAGAKVSADGRPLLWKVRDHRGC